IRSRILRTPLHVVNIEKILVDQNSTRFGAPGKIDLGYLDALSYAGVDGLIQLYEIQKDIPGLHSILKERQQMAESQSQERWQSFNVTKQNALKKLKSLDLD